MSEEIKRVYELGYILSAAVSDGEITKETDVLKDTISTAGNKVLAEGIPEFIDLAYTMEKNIASKKIKYNQGYFGWIKFEGDPASLESIKKVLDSNINLVRYILIKTTIDNSVVFKKPKIEAKRILANGEDLVISEVEATDEVVDLHNEHENVSEIENPAQSEKSVADGEEESL